MHDHLGVVGVRRRLATAIFAAFLMQSWLPAQAAASYLKVRGLKFGTVAWVRSGPGVQYSRVGFLPATARHISSDGCIRLSNASVWCRVRYRNIKGWASGRYLAFDRAPTS